MEVTRRSGVSKKEQATAVPTMATMMIMRKMTNFLAMDGPLAVLGLERYLTISLSYHKTELMVRYLYEQVIQKNKNFGNDWSGDEFGGEGRGDNYGGGERL